MWQKKLQKLGQKHRMWRIWAKSLGEKSGATDDEADRVAIIRTCIVACYIITNLFIIAGVIRHWNDQTQILVEIHQENPVPPLVKTNYNHTGQFE